MIFQAFASSESSHPRRRPRRSRTVALLLCLPLALASTGWAAEAIQQVDEVCPADVQKEVEGWSKIPFDLQGDWKAFGKAGGASLDGAEDTMKFDGNILVEEIEVGGAVAYRSLTGVAGGKTVSYWTDVANRACSRIEGALTQEENNYAVREMGAVTLEYERYQRPTGCLAYGAACRPSKHNCCKKCVNNKCT